MKERCANPNHLHYKSYGGRGIRVCDAWQSFVVFASDVGQPPSERHSLDRIDNHGGYEPCNVRWATSSEQRRNTRVNHLLTLNGETHCITEWAERLGLGKTTIRERLRRGWTIEAALHV